MKQLILSFKEKRIKSILVERHGNSYDVLGGGAVEIPTGSIEAGAIKNYDVIKEKVKSLIGSVAEAKSYQVNILLGEETSFLKVIKETKEKDVLESPQIQEEIPYPLKGSFTTLRLLKNKDIQLVATPRELISIYQKLFREIGLEVESMFPEPVVFLPFLEKAQRPSLIISGENGSILFAVISESGIFFSTTKHFKENVFDKKVLAGWIKEVIEQEIKPLSPNLDFEALIFGENENEIFEELQQSKVSAKILNINLRKVAPQLNDISKYKRLVITAGLSKHIPGFHVKGTQPASVVTPSNLPGVNLKYVLIGILSLIIIAGVVWSTPKLASLIKSTSNTNPIPTVSDQPKPTATPSAQASPSAKKDGVQEKPKVEEKKEEPKPVLKRSSLKIEVLNGSGVPGIASDTAIFLEGKGYKVTSTGNAANYNYAKTEIRLKKSKEDYRELLTKDLSNRYNVVVGTVIEESSSTDVQVIIGKQ